MKHLKSWKKIAMIGAAALVVGATSVTGLAAANTQSAEDNALQVQTTAQQTVKGNENAAGVMNQVRSGGDVYNSQSNGNGTCDRLCDGTGDGSGNGYGDGTCDGTGNGDGTGYGNGNGDGSGDGVCDGTGNGNGYGDGTGDGVCDGTGNGDGTCDGTGMMNGKTNVDQDA